MLTPLLAVGVFFGLLEGVLALVGVQPALRHEDPFVGFASNVPLFVEETGSDGPSILATAGNKLRFFNHQQFPRVKAPGTYRIFCVGGSTTYGRPYDDTTSFAGWLRELLPVAEPGRGWEVINAGGISYASYRVVHLMEELAAYEPDLFIVYSGHNEFLEERTYGAVRDLPAAIKSTSALLARTRTWAAMSLLLGRTVASPDQGRGGRVQLPDAVDTLLDRSAGPEVYERDDALRDGVLKHYRISLERMAEIASSAGADVIFVTPASNLKDSSPFKSQHGDAMAEPARLRSQELLATALARIGEARWNEALAALDAAIVIDARFAELHYRRGRVLFVLGEYEEAAEALRRARDEDVCPLRALSPVRRTVVEVARDQGKVLVDFADLLERRLLAERGHRIAGAEYFLDHVHPTIEGYRVLAVALVEAMIERGTVQPDAGWGEAAVAAVATRVEGGLDRGLHGRALANLAQVLNWAGKAEDARRLAGQALETGWENPQTVVTAATILGRLSQLQGETEQAQQYYRRALSADPRNAEAHFQLGLVLLNARKRDLLSRAAAHILFASVFWPDNDMTHQTLGLAMAERGHYAAAYRSLAEARRLNLQNEEARSALARLRELVGPEARDPALPKVSLKEYPSGAVRSIAQVKPDPSGRDIPDGLLTEWYENGEPERLMDYADGVPHGVEVRWGRDGRVVSRAEYTHGKLGQPPEGT